MPRAFSISTDSIAAERARVAGDLEKFDISRVVKLDTLELRPLGPTDVHLRILAVSGEHNINHAALADTVNIADLRGGKIYPGNSAVGEVVAIGEQVTKFAVGDVVVTSGIDGIYPKGFVIGQIESIQRVGGGFGDIVIKPAVPFASLEALLVVLSPERPLAESTAADSGATQGAQARE